MANGQPSLEEIFGTQGGPPKAKPSLEEIFGKKKEEPGALATALDYGGRALDYAGGLTRTAAASPFGVVQGEDVMAALKGKAPTTSEYLEEAGVPAGASLSEAFPSMYSKTGAGLPLEKGGMFDPTARGAAGFVGDVALDPATYLTGGISAAKGPLKKALTAFAKPLSTVATPLGKLSFKSGMKKIDQLVGAKGKEAVSDILIKYGIGGNKRKIAKGSANLANKLHGQRQGLLQQADDLGATVDFSEEITRFMSNIIDVAIDTKSPQLKNAIKSIKKTAEDYAAVGRVSTTMASDLKTEIYQQIPKNVWELTGDSKKAGELLADMARGLKEAIETSVEKASGQGATVKAINKDLGGLLTASKAMGKEATQELNTPLFSAVDGILAGYNPLALATKKAAETAKKGGFRTKIGSRMMGVQTPLQKVTDPAAKRGLLNLLRGENQ